MKLEAGMYVRTNLRTECVIRQIKNIIYDDICEDSRLILDESTKYTYYIEDNKFKASFNILDLIKVGDIVETPIGKYNVLRVDNMFNGKLIIQEISGTHEPRFISLKYLIEQKMLISVMTQEEFYKRSYKIGG